MIVLGLSVEIFSGVKEPSSEVRWSGYGRVCGPSYISGGLIAVCYFRTRDLPSSTLWKPRGGYPQFNPFSCLVGGNLGFY